MASTLAQFDAFLKDYYTKDKIDDLTKKDRPFFGMVQREEDLGGDQYVHPFIFQNPQGFGATLAKAQQGSSQGSGNGNLQGRKWKVAYGDYSASVSIGDKVIKASRSNVGAFLRDQETEINGLYNGFGDTFSTYLYSNGGQSVGQFSNITTGVITLTNADDVVNFEVGQILVVSVNDGSDPSHILVAGSAQGFVVNVDRNAGTLTVSATSGGAAGTPTNWAANQFMFRDGDFGGSGATRILLGLGAWIPSAAPTTTTFENINRTIDSARMSGIRLTAAEIASVTLEQRLKRLVTRMRGRNFGPGPDAVFLNPEKWQNVADSLESRGYREIGAEAEFGYENITFKAGGKTVKLYADPFCPIGTAFALKMDTVKLGGLSKIPEVVNGDGLEMLRAVSTNDYEYRLVAYPAFVVAAPGFCGRVATV